MKRLILLFVLCLILPASADMVIEGGVNYNVKSAREELQTTKRPIIQQDLIKNYLYDKDYAQNHANLLNGRTELNDRVLAYFSDASYAVMYRDNEMQVFYYARNGSLTHIEKKTGTEYPYRAYKYSINGNLVNMSLRVSKGETFIYTPQGKLLAHWLGANGYDEVGNLIMTRKYVE